jgi:hypothetical protein
MDFQAIQDVGTCFFNERGQLCLRLFDFEVLRPIRQVNQDQWRARKIVGDECQVFMLQSGFGEITKFNFPGKNIVGDNQHVGLVKNTEREHSENHYPKSVQCPTSTCAESILEVQFQGSSNIAPISM